MSLATPPKHQRKGKNKRPSQSAKELVVPSNEMSLNDDAGLPTDIHGVSHHDAPPASTGAKIVTTLVVVLPFLGLVAAIALAWQYSLVSPFFIGMLAVGWLITGMGNSLMFSG